MSKKSTTGRMHIPWRLLFLFTILSLATGTAAVDATLTTQTVKSTDVPSELSTVFPSTTSPPNSSSVTSGSANSKTVSSKAAAQTHVVQVGNGDHKFRPDTIRADAGDVSVIPSHTSQANYAFSNFFSTDEQPGCRVLVLSSES